MSDTRFNVGLAGFYLIAAGLHSPEHPLVSAFACGAAFALLLDSIGKWWQERSDRRRSEVSS